MKVKQQKAIIRHKRIVKAKNIERNNSPVGRKLKLRGKWNKSRRYGSANTPVGRRAASNKSNTMMQQKRG